MTTSLEFSQSFDHLFQPRHTHLETGELAVRISDSNLPPALVRQSMSNFSLDRVRHFIYNLRMDYERQLAEALKQYQRLENQKIAVEKQMTGWREIIESLQFLAQQEDERSKELPPVEPLPDLEPLGLTDAIRTVLREHRFPMGATDVRDALEARGIAGSSSKNLLINVHTVLKRLRKADEVHETTKDGQTTYKWMRLIDRALKGLRETGIITEPPTREESLARNRLRVPIRSRDKK